ncbi:hypothetical protein ACFO4O_02950 [Glaciecola siphonariae]|uniref:Uncharacterized protein n=1 Tax=Glaciecola siphonariae TaxID=521012 RepID=A0ABV9LRJ8_9ALTE
MEHTCNNLAFISAQREKNFKPFLFVETHFVHKREMIIVLAMCENQRRLHLSNDTAMQADNVKKIIIGEVCATHYNAKGNTLPVWGDIQSYKYFYKENRAWLFDVSGKFVADIVEKQPEKAEGWEHDEHGNKHKLGHQLS